MLGIIEEHQYIFTLCACLLVAIIFVASLYIWNSHDRNHPATIKKRFCSVFVAMLISLFITKQSIVVDKFRNVSLMELLGFRLSGLVSAFILPLMLTMILFLGPLSMQNFSVFWYFVSNPLNLVSLFCNLKWLRNVIVAPISEEFAFRACMMPLLLQCFRPMTAVFICPLFFGVAHLHHVSERLKAGDPINTVIMISSVELLYTTLFGMYSAFLFVRTGHFVAPAIVHSFCNIIGFPDFNKLFTYKNPRKTILLVLFFTGIVFWAMLLLPLTNQNLYNNHIFWEED